MNYVACFFRKMWILVRREKFRGELAEEMAFHREHAEQEFLTDGMPCEANSRQAIFPPWSAHLNRKNPCSLPLLTSFINSTLALRFLRGKPCWTGFTIHRPHTFAGRRRGS
jgi:hypothetical protein